MGWDKNLAINVGISYLSSWVFFFLTLQFFVAAFGRVKGSAIDYAVSGLVLLVVAWVIKKYDLVNRIQSVTTVTT